MSRPLFVHFLPDLVSPEQLSGGIVVVIDVLRASTTIATALNHGAGRIIPCVSIDQALAVRDQEHVANRDQRSATPANSGVLPLLGGERGGVRIEGFDLSNSPAEYEPQVVGGRTIVFTTTNGTRALARCEQAARILVGAFINLSAISRALQADDRPVHLLCAGTDGSPTAEDILFAGALGHDVCVAAGSEGWTLSDSAEIAVAAWRGAVEMPCLEESSAGHVAGGLRQERLSPHVFNALCRSRGGRNLLRLGYESDIRYCSQIDLISVLPVCQQMHRPQNQVSGPGIPSMEITLA